MIDAGVIPGNVPNSGYFADIFPYAQSTDAITGANYSGAQAYYNELYDGNRGNETAPLFYNDTPPVNRGIAPANQAFRFFFLQTSSIYVQSTVGVSSYNALQLSVRQTMRHSLEYDVNYTYSKSMDQGSDPERVLSGSPIINTLSPSQLYADSDFDVRHNITANYTAPLPFGRGAPFLNHQEISPLPWGAFAAGSKSVVPSFPTEGKLGSHFAVAHAKSKLGQPPTPHRVMSAVPVHSVLNRKASPVSLHPACVWHPQAGSPVQ